MSKIKRLLSVLVAVLMLLTMPITTGISRAIAEGTTEPTETETPSEGVALEMEDLDPATLNVHKLGEIEEEQGDDTGVFDPDDLEVEDLNRIVRATIFLDGKSVIDQGYAIRGIADNGGAMAYRNKLIKQQAEVEKEIEKAIGHDLNVRWNLTLLVNAMAVEIPYKDIIKIQTVKGVKKAVVETEYEAPKPVEVDPNTANTSENMVGAKAAWAAGYTGAGSRVAIIDTGLDIDHELVDPDAFMYSIDKLGKASELMTADDIPSGLSGTYRNAKVPYAYNYRDKDTRIDHQDSGSNHGSHVAGIAAGNRYVKRGDNIYVESATEVKAVGMAPDAQILVMKVFSNTGAYPSDYFPAIEDAIMMDCDAVNLSLGSASQGWTFDPDYQEALNNFANSAHNEGMVVSISAGNNGSIVDYMSTAIKNYCRRTVSWLHAYCRVCRYSQQSTHIPCPGIFG